jgi:hypothetical protein
MVKNKKSKNIWQFNPLFDKSDIKEFKILFKQDIY